jgi:2-polyprenyl-3-methyl-5-hydroxy-6-metoxy-1,4-benzoquinol methylase
MLQPAFDNYAATYDAHFTNSLIGITQREHVFSYLKVLDYFKDKSVLEINCGTGHDALFLNDMGAIVTATDISSEMLAIAKAKDRSTKINFIQTSIQKIDEVVHLNSYAVLFSNFGGLNCLSKPELGIFLAKVNAAKIDQLVFVIMGTNCLFEQFYFLVKGDFKKAFRRKKTEGVLTEMNKQTFLTYYYSPKQIKNMVGASYSVQKKLPIGLLVPPSYLESFFKKHLLLFNVLKYVNNLFCKFSIFSNYSDHYLIHFKLNS